MPDITKYNTLITYLIAKIRSTTIYSTFDRIIKYARRFLWITRIFRYIGIAAAIIETSAVLILTAAVIVVLVPLIILILAVFFIADLIVGRRILNSGELSKYLSRERIYVIFDAGGFGNGFAKELANDGAAVFSVTADPTKRFVSAKKKDGIYYVRHAFFFRLKRKKLNKIKDNLTYLL